MAKKTTKKASGKKAAKAPTRKKTARTKASASSGKRAPARRARRGSGEDTGTRLERLARSVVGASLKGTEPVLHIPTRTLSNTRWNKARGILQMGDSEQERQLFNLNQAKKFMQMMLHAASVKDLLDENKTLSLRGMFYKGLHTIQGTKDEKTFADQSESDAILEDLEVSLGSLREELHIFAKKAGTLVGNITIVDSGDEIDCRRMGSGGYAIPSIVEPDVIQFKKCEADFVLHVEKNTVWSRFNEDKFWKKHNCILTEGGGQPPRGVRRLLHRLHHELGLPIYCLLDCDPWGHYIYSVIKQGSISLAFESERLAIPEARFIGLRARDYQAHDLTDDVQIALSERDITRARQIMNYPWFKQHRGWQREIRQMLDNGFKMEVESLITKNISYVTEVYVPQKLEEESWLT